MITKTASKFVILAVLDGWGLAAPGPGNAISQAITTNINRFWASYPHTQLAASGEAVGLPRGEDGNTETGHLNLGAGRIVYQDLARINMSIADGSFFTNKVLTGAIDHAKRNNSDLHYMGLIGSGGVHSNIEHLFALIQLAARYKFDRLYLHLFTDGRDSPQTSAETYINSLKAVIEKEGVGQIATIMGRYWAMDRDLRWDRTEKAYNALTKGIGTKALDPNQAIKNSYNQGLTDEFIDPIILTNASGLPKAVIKNGDAVVFFNFRIDRPRQLARAFVLKDFARSGTAKWDFDPYSIKYKKSHLAQVSSAASMVEPFPRGQALANLYFATMTQYSRNLVEEGAHVAFPPETVIDPLGKVVSDQNMRQLRMAESEKERFVTFYFNGQQEAAFPGEERLIIPSPKIPLYDQKPEMSAREVTEALLNKLKSETYPFVLVNFANADMVGHTGNIGATATACEVVDECVGRLANYALAYDGVLLVTADHGNAEEMIDSQTGQIETEHSNNPVPFIAISKNFIGKPQELQSGILADIAPTILNLLGITPPQVMTGRNLLQPLYS